ncbi:hypothetical protein ACRZ9H_002427, partial [Escherichia coli O51:H10]
INGAIFRFMVLNTPCKAETAPVSHAAFLCPFLRYGRVARIPKNSRKVKDTGRLCTVFKYLTALLNTGLSEQMQRT